MKLPKELIEDYSRGTKIIVLSKKYDIEYNTLYWKLGELGIRRKEKPGGSRRSYERKNKERNGNHSRQLRNQQKENTLISEAFHRTHPHPLGMRPVIKDRYDLVKGYINFGGEYD